jgi:hypothetical protein
MTSSGRPHADQSLDLEQFVAVLVADDNRQPTVIASGPVFDHLCGGLHCFGPRYGRVKSRGLCR